MSNPEEWITKMESEDSLERIVARINLLRIWPDHREEDKKQHMYFDLSDIVHKHSSAAVDYIADLKDINEKAFAIRAIYFGVMGSIEKLTEEEQTDNTKAKNKLSEILENFTGRLPEVENADSKAELARKIATSCSLEKALSAVDVLWAMGWNKLVYPSLYEYYGIESCSEVLTSVVINSQHPEVGRKALGLIGQVPNERGDNYRDKHLKKIILSRNIDMAIAAVDLFIETKCAESGEPRVKIAKGMVSVYECTIGMDMDRKPKYEYAQQPVVEYTFDLVMKLTPEEKRIEFAYACISCRPPELAAKAYNYLSEHIDDINKMEDHSRRENILVNLMQYGKEDVRLKALDFIAQSPEGIIDSVENIAQLYGDRRAFIHLHENVRERVTYWACKYVKEFVKLADKDLARDCLTFIGSGDGGAGDGWKYEDETGEKISQIADRELEKVPKLKTQKEELLDIFRTSESKP